MTRFTIFSIILAISVIAVMSDLTLKDYFNDGQANVLIEPKAEESPPAPPGSASKESSSNSDKPAESESETVLQPIEPPPPPESVPPPPLPPEPKVTEAVIREAGFTGAFSPEPFNGKLYQLLDITKNPVTALAFYQIQDEDSAIATVTEMVLRDEIRSLQLYTLLQNKTKPYIDLSLNETNAYGDRSFYINHAKKPDEAFLTVKIGSRLYAIAYVKSYHLQVKELIKILNNN